MNKQSYKDIAAPAAEPVVSDNHLAIQNACNDTDNPPAPARNKTTLYFAVLAALVILGFASLFIYTRAVTPTGASIVNPTVGDLHALNLKGALGPERGYVHNGFSFIFLDGLWYTQIQRGEKAYDIPLHFSPRQLVNVTKKGRLNESFDKSDELYIVVNPLSTDSDYIALAASELAQNIAFVVDRMPVGACDRNETSMCEERPIITCETDGKPSVYLLQEPGPEVELNGNCIILRGIKYDVVRAADYLLLDWYNVI